MKYDASVEVSIKLTYHVLIEVEAQDLRDAEQKITWQAMGLTRQELDRLIEANPFVHSYDGQETTVEQVGEIEMVPEEETAHE